MRITVLVIGQGEQVRGICRVFDAARVCVCLLPLVLNEWTALAAGLGRGATLGRVSLVCSSFQVAPTLPGS